MGRGKNGKNSILILGGKEASQGPMQMNMALLHTSGFSSSSCRITGKSRTREIWELGSRKRDFPLISFKQEVVSVLMVERLWKMKKIYLIKSLQK